MVSQFIDEETGAPEFNRTCPLVSPPSKWESCCCLAQGRCLTITLSCLRKHQKAGCLFCEALIQSWAPSQDSPDVQEWGT